jgi:CHAD domain-containing protein
MPPSRKSTAKTASRAKSSRAKPSGAKPSGAKPARPVQRLPPKPRLNGAMACDTAFRIVARRHLDALGANHEPTCAGDPTALHQMRVALTHLRTAILFFSPMVEDAVRDEIRDELKWLNSELGAVRDLDVAVERVVSLDKKQPEALSAVGAWEEKRAEAHRNLARTLRSVRYEWLIEQAAGWIENGPWSTKRGKGAAAERSTPIGLYTLDKLEEWEKRLLKHSRRLRKMGTKKRHHLRLLNKKLSYSIDSFEDLFENKEFSKQKLALKHLRRAQRSLGQLNDDARGHEIAEELQRGGVQTRPRFLRRGKKKRLLKKASRAYRRLNQLT